MQLTIVDGARLLWCAGLAQKTGQPRTSVHGWLGNGTYAPVALSKTLVLSNVSNHAFLDALGGDLNRVASAASETLQNIREIDRIPKSLGWPYVKLYYASLFYAHTVLRIWGVLPTYITTADLMGLRSTLEAYSIVSPFDLETGQFLLTANMTSSDISMSPDKGRGGSHEAVWRALSKALQALETAISHSQFLNEDKRRLIQEVKLFRALFTNQGRDIPWHF